MRAIFWLNGQLVRMLCVLAVLLIGAMMLGISAEVILRAAGGASVPEPVRANARAIGRSVCCLTASCISTFGAPLKAPGAGGLA